MFQLAVPASSVYGFNILISAESGGCCAHRRGGGVYHVLVSLFLVPQVPCYLQLFVEILAFPTDPPLGAHGGAEILETGI